MTQAVFVVSPGKGDLYVSWGTVLEEYLGDGVSVRVFTDSAEAVGQIAKEKPRAIVFMSKYFGYMKKAEEVAREHPDLNVVLLTADPVDLQGVAVLDKMHLDAQKVRAVVLGQ